MVQSSGHGLFHQLSSSTGARLLFSDCGDKEQIVWTGHHFSLDSHFLLIAERAVL